MSCKHIAKVLTFIVQTPLRKGLRGMWPLTLSTSQYMSNLNTVSVSYFATSVY